MSLPPSTPFSEAPRNTEGPPGSSPPPYPPVLGATGHPGAPSSCAPAPLQNPGTMATAPAVSGQLQPFMDTGERVLIQWGVPTAGGNVAAAAWGPNPSLQQKQQQPGSFFPTASTPKDPETPFGPPLVQGPLANTTEGPTPPVGPAAVPAEADQWGPPVRQNPWVGPPTSTNPAGGAAAGAPAAAPPTVPLPESATQQQPQQQPQLPPPQQQQLSPAQQQRQHTRQQHALIGGEGVPGAPPGAPASGVEFAAAEGKWQGRWSQGPPSRTQQQQQQQQQQPASVASIGFEGAPPVAEGPVYSQEGPLNPAAANAEFFRPVTNEMHQHNYGTYHLPPEGGGPLQLRNTGPLAFMQCAEDPTFTGPAEEQQTAKRKTESLHTEGSQHRWPIGAPGPIGPPGTIGAPGAMGATGVLAVPGAPATSAPTGAASKLDCAPPQNGPLRVAASAAPLPQQPQQQQQQQQPEVQQLPEPVGMTGMGAFQRKGVPPIVNDRQQQGEPGLFKAPNSSCGGPPGPSWVGLPGAQGVMGGSVGTTPYMGAPYMGAPTPAFLRGPNGLTVSQQVLRGAPRSSSWPQLGAPQGPPADSLLSAVASQQYALLTVRAFLLACEEPVAPPWKQIAAWGPWLSGQQQGPPHAGLLGPHRRGGLQQPASGAVLTEAEEPTQAAEEGGQGGPHDKASPECPEESSITASHRAAADESLGKPDRKKKRGGAPQGGPASKKAAKSQRAAAGEGALVTAEDVWRSSGELLLPNRSPPLPLSAVQQADLCVELLTALGRLRPQWRRRGNRVSYQLHLARLRPSLLLPAAAPPSWVLEGYRAALGPLVAHIAELPYVHLAPGEAEEVVEEVQMLKGPEAIDSVLHALDALEPWGPQGNSQIEFESEAMEAEAMRDTGDPRQQLLMQHQQQQQQQAQRQHQQQQQLLQQQQAEASRLADAPADGVRGSSDREVLLAYNPDLKVLRQLNYLVPGTRVYIHQDVLDMKLADMGLPPLPSPPAGSADGGPSASRGPLSRFVMAEAGERYFAVPCGEYLPLKLVSPPQHQLQFSVGQVVQLLQEGRLCLLRFTEREALKRRLPLLGAPSGPPSETAGGGSQGAAVGFKPQRGSKPACCPAPVGIEKICRCKCNHRRQELCGQLKQRLRVDKKGCLAAIRDCIDLNHVAFSLPSARTCQLEVLAYLFGVNPWLYAKNRHEAPPEAEVASIVRRYKELVSTKEYEQVFKAWLEEQAREKSLQQEITADITAIGLNLKDTDAGCLNAAANTPQQDPRVQASIAQLVPNTPICVRFKALLGLPSGNEQHLRGVVRRAQILPRGRAISLAINNRKEEFVLLPEELQTLVAHDDLRLVRMRSRQWFAYEAHAAGAPSAASGAAGAPGGPSSDHQWASPTQDDSWKGGETQS